MRLLVLVYLALPRGGGAFRLPAHGAFAHTWGGLGQLGRGSLVAGVRPTGLGAVSAATASTTSAATAPSLEELKAQCRAAGLPVSGRKAELAERLAAAAAAAAVSAPATQETAEPPKRRNKAAGPAPILADAAAATPPL